MSCSFQRMQQCRKAIAKLVDRLQAEGFDLRDIECAMGLEHSSVIFFFFQRGSLVIKDFEKLLEARSEEAAKQLKVINAERGGLPNT